MSDEPNYSYLITHTSSLITVLSYVWNNRLGQP